MQLVWRNCGTYKKNFFKWNLRLKSTISVILQKKIIFHCDDCWQTDYSVTSLLQRVTQYLLKQLGKSQCPGSQWSQSLPVTPSLQEHNSPGGTFAHPPCIQKFSVTPRKLQLHSSHRGQLNRSGAHSSHLSPMKPVLYSQIPVSLQDT